MNPARLYQPSASVTCSGGPPCTGVGGRLRSLRVDRCTPVHLFVYGTLRLAAAHPMHASLRAAASFVGPARVRGVMVLAGSYPGIVLDARAGWVVGELYHLRDPGVLAPLDAYEEAGSAYPEPQEFRRVQAMVEPQGRPPQLAWIYEYGWPTAGLEVIASGDFLAGEAPAQVPDSQGPVPRDPHVQGEP